MIVVVQKQPWLPIKTASKAKIKMM